MVNRNSSYLAKFFLKRRGFTLVELLVVVAILAILGLIALLSLRGGTQIQKARDSRRKSDLAKIQRCLEEYNNDHGYYLLQSSFSCGATSLSPCMPSIPCDPYYTTQAYVYQTDGTTKSSWYKIYANLEYTSDPAVAASGCSSGCIASGSTYNFLVSSPNASKGGATCNGLTAPTCGQPQTYVGMCASCCPGSQYRVTQFDTSYYCCLDAACQ